MKKTLLSLIATLSFSSHAYVIDTSACAGTEYIYDAAGDLVQYNPAVHTDVTSETPVVYSGFETVPHLFLHINRSANVLVSNASENAVTFFYNSSYHALSNGYGINISPENVYGIFSNSNSPLSAGGAQMPGKTAGQININQTSSTTLGYAAIRWNSSACMTVPPMLVSVENVISTGKGSGHSVYLVNEGNRW